MARSVDFASDRDSEENVAANFIALLATFVKDFVQVAVSLPPRVSHIKRKFLTQV